MAGETKQAAEMPSLDEVLNTWLGLTAAAKAAGVTESTMHHMMVTGKVRMIKTPTGRLVEPTQLVEYAKAHRERYQMDEYKTRWEQRKAKRARQIEEEEARRMMAQQQGQTA